MNISRIALAGGVAASTVLILAGTASAHVSVQPQGEAAKGGYAVINFKVPNERDDASTTKLEVNFPTDHPLASVMPQPVPGWKIDVTKSKLAKPLDMHGKKINEAVSKVTWTADGGKIEPGRFQQFPLSVGQLPEDADQLVFKAIQTYDNKEVVRWIEEPKDGAEEPESPAPVLKLTAAADDAHGATAASGSGAADKDAAAKDKQTTASASSSSSDTTARVLGIVGIVIGVAGVAFGVLAGRRRTA
ncbi:MULTISPECIES: YcnI family protein [unclassified Streptomyces]|uniref:YcnI family copper-binding membrane protein n=1 Tax=unclassified Streptomyces TaxID=2593676 RepID=UPI00224EECD0|nr:MULTISPECIES: YcnI family protein [unclassified Streptomyces]MCX5141543.1 YcnI family protein [Streptomyces sp. NBC_00338]WRZ66044.1 YcnI family protein [Streptomyces sp. NBC_01257]WSU60054.1 YcnI family protein [Streptomyces sp. NBC_01104]